MAQLYIVNEFYRVVTYYLLHIETFSAQLQQFFHLQNTRDAVQLFCNLLEQLTCFFQRRAVTL